MCTIRWMLAAVKCTLQWMYGLCTCATHPQMIGNRACRRSKAADSQVMAPDKFACLPACRGCQWAFHSQVCLMCSHSPLARPVHKRSQYTPGSSNTCGRARNMTCADTTVFSWHRCSAIQGSQSLHLDARVGTPEGWVVWDPVIHYYCSCLRGQKFQHGSRPAAGRNQDLRLRHGLQLDSTLSASNLPASYHSALHGRALMLTWSLMDILATALPSKVWNLAAGYTA